MKWNTTFYDNKHGFVSKYGEDLIQLLAPEEGEMILDLGCGTGDLAAMIHQKGAMVIGLDNSKEMLEAARQKYPHIRFDNQSATDFFYNDIQFDAVFSNATLHWVLAQEAAVKCIYQALKPGGRFVAELGGRGNVSNIISALKISLTRRGFLENASKNIWYFPSLSQYTTLLEQIGFRVVFAAHFDRETLLQDDQGIINWLQMFAQPYLQNINSETINAIGGEVEEQIKDTNFKNGNWYADYVRLRVVAIKN